jgi:hypothetical protein
VDVVVEIQVHFVQVESRDLFCPKEEQLRERDVLASPDDFPIAILQTVPSNVFPQTSHQRLRGVPPEAGPLPKESVAAPFRAQLRALASNYQSDRVPLLDVVVAEPLAVFEKAAETPQFLRLSGSALQVLDVVLDVIDQLAKLNVDVTRLARHVDHGYGEADDDERPRRDAARVERLTWLKLSAVDIQVVETVREVDGSQLLIDLDDRVTPLGVQRSESIPVVADDEYLHDARENGMP